MFLQRGELNQIAEFLERVSAPKFTSNAKNYSRNALHHFDWLIGLICSKGVSLSAFAFLVMLAVVFNGCAVRTSAFMTVRIVFPFFCLSFCKRLGEMTGVSFGLLRPVITHPSSPAAVALAAWFYMGAVFIAVFHAVD